MPSSTPKDKPPPPVPQSDFDPGVNNNSHNNNSTSYPDPICPFCHISSTYEPYDPSSPPPSTNSTLASTSKSNSNSNSTTPTPSISTLNPEATSPQPNTYLVLSTPHLLAFLDIMPLSHGHILLCTRAHRERLTDVSPHEAAQLGRYLRILSAAVSRVTGVGDWNVVQNNGAAAAQVVPHMHFHVIPRPELKDKGRERFTSTMFGRGQREDLDEEEAEVLAERIRQMVKVVVQEEMEEERKRTDKKGAKL